MYGCSVCRHRGFIIVCLAMDVIRYGQLITAWHARLALPAPAIASSHRTVDLVLFPVLLYPTQRSLPAEGVD